MCGNCCLRPFMTADQRICQNYKVQYFQRFPTLSFHWYYTGVECYIKIPTLAELMYTNNTSHSYYSGCTNCDDLRLKSHELQARLECSEREKQGLHEEMLSLKFGVSFLKTGNSDFKTKFYTGLPTFAAFLWLSSLVQGILPKFSSVSLHNLLLIVLMKLRLNTENYDIVCRFNIPLYQTFLTDVSLSWLTELNSLFTG